MTTKLALADIVDLRAYERERPEFLKEVIALKAKRRIGVGPYITFVFENRTTVRFQIQEMARAEKMLTDEAIQIELDIYNPLVVGPGELAMTMFIELTSETDLRTWLPRLAGIERTAVFLLGEGEAAHKVEVHLDPDHESQLTREDMTASVHYMWVKFTEEQAKYFAAGTVRIAFEHDAYAFETELSDDTKQSITSDWSTS